LSCEYLRDFWKKFEMILMGYSRAGGKLIHKKNRSKKSRDTVPLIKLANNMSVRLEDFIGKVLLHLCMGA
jgi:hypothetical protein